MRDTYTIGRVAEMAGISVRTLHHWDAIGLVRPSLRSWAGYREYSDDDVARIRQVCLYRETGMALADIAAVLDDPETDSHTHLARQRDLLVERISRLQEMVSAVEEIMEKTMDKKTPLTAAQLAEILGPDWNPSWQDEAQERWGSTDEWAQAEARKAAMSVADWKHVKDASEAFEEEIATAFREGIEPGSPAANAIAERQLAWMNQWFDTTYQKLCVIAKGYVEDARFREHYDSREPGLAQWLRDVIHADARAHGVDPESACWE